MISVIIGTSIGLNSYPVGSINLATKKSLLMRLAPDWLFKRSLKFFKNDLDFFDLKIIIAVAVLPSATACLFNISDMFRYSPNFACEEGFLLRL